MTATGKASAMINSFLAEHDLCLLQPRQVGDRDQIVERQRRRLPLGHEPLQNIRRQVGQPDHPADEPVRDLLRGGNVLEGRHGAGLELPSPAPRPGDGAKDTCKDNNWSSIEEPGYGKGYIAALGLWRQYLDGLNALRDERGMTVIQIAHTDIKRFDSPEHEPYDRYVIKLHARASALLQEHSDAVLFANYRISTVKSDVGFNKKVTRALGSGERVLYTAERPAFLAKNRYGLPDMLPLDWQAFAAAMPQP